MSYFTFETRPGTYFDSVVLMQLQKSLVGLDGVIDAGVVMATPANKDVLKAAGFDLSGIDAGADDLLITINADSEANGSAALAAVDGLLKANRSGGGGSGDFRPKSLKAAAQLRPEADWVLISVPGRYAADVAHDALDLNKHVFLYSDNVSAQDEAALKTKGAEKQLLVMGPDCGTAMINGIGLGFANRVRRGNIGIVAASGTGLQAVMSGIHARGGGISHAIGTGGRDLKSEIGGKTMFPAIRALGDDPDTDAIVVVSKPPAPALVSTLIATLRQTGKPAVVNLIGYPTVQPRLGSIYFARSLDEAATLATSLAELQGQAPPPAWPMINGYIRGLFSGGTLAYECQLGLQPLLADLYLNIPLHEEQRLPDVWTSQAHTIIDLGEDEFTQGRLHPMMDNDLRLRRFEQEAADPETGLILLDLVLGDGSHLDPASEFADAIQTALAARPDLRIAVMLLGTDLDPQNKSEQYQALKAAGAVIFETVDALLQAIAGALPTPAKPDIAAISLSQKPFAAINVGLESFYTTLKEQDVDVVHVDWRPPAGGNKKMLDILKRMKKKDKG